MFNSYQPYFLGGFFVLIVFLVLFLVPAGFWAFYWKTDDERRVSLVNFFIFSCIFAVVGLSIAGLIFMAFVYVSSTKPTKNLGKYAKFIDKFEKFYIAYAMKIETSPDPNRQRETIVGELMDEIRRTMSRLQVARNAVEPLMNGLDYNVYANNRDTFKTYMDILVEITERYYTLYRIENSEEYKEQFNKYFTTIKDLYQKLNETKENISKQAVETRRKGLFTVNKVRGLFDKNVKLSELERAARKAYNRGDIVAWRKLKVKIDDLKNSIRSDKISGTGMIYEDQGTFRARSSRPPPKISGSEKIYEDQGTFRARSSRPPPKISGSEKIYEDQGTFRARSSRPPPKISGSEKIYEDQGTFSARSSRPSPKISGSEKIYEDQGTFSARSSRPSPKISGSEKTQAPPITSSLPTAISPPGFNFEYNGTNYTPIAYSWILDYVCQNYQDEDGGYSFFQCNNPSTKYLPATQESLKEFLDFYDINPFDILPPSGP